MKIAVTGAKGLLGWHAAARLHAANCAARYRGEAEPFRLVRIDRACFSDPAALATALEGCEAVLHFAGINRGQESEVLRGNPEIARQLVEACQAAGARPHIVYANSLHSRGESVYGRSKREAAQILADFSVGGLLADFILPHIFGECAQPDYNNVTATIIDRLWKGEEPQLDPTGRVELLYAGAAAQMMIDAAVAGRGGQWAPGGREMSVLELYDKLKHFDALYRADVFPDLSDPFDLALFNSYRTAGYPEHFPKALKVNADQRGVLFECAKGGNSSHTFLSTTLPGIIRGNHFHFSLVERFVVVKGSAVIRIRKVLSDEVHEFRVSGDEPVAIDQIPFHTHSIENVGKSDLITFFWAHRMFDPANPDTYADPV
jgi:Nucleoside-diphosphate-sugar epimerases